MNPFSLQQRIASINHQVQLYVQLWQTVVLPTLMNERIDMDHAAYCSSMRGFIAAAAQLHEIHERHPRALAFQAALAPYLGIEHVLQQKRVQVRLPAQCEAFYRDMKHRVSDSSKRKRPEAGERVRIPRRAPSGPLDAHEFDPLFRRGQKRGWDE